MWFVLFVFDMVLSMVFVLVSGLVVVVMFSGWVVVGCVDI